MTIRKPRSLAKRTPSPTNSPNSTTSEERATKPAQAPKPKVKAARSARTRKAKSKQLSVDARKAERVERKEASEAALAAKRADAAQRRAKALAKVEAVQRRKDEKIRASVHKDGLASPLSRAKASDRARAVAQKIREDVRLAALPKPPYRVPSMAEIDATPDNGLRVVSTFSGCGGACLGLKMAGFRVLHANEFIPIAAESYRANFPGTFLDTRDVRQLQAEEILERIGLQPGELDVFEGSPPCSSFSIAGKRDKLWGREKEYSGTIQRVDDLFFEFTRLVRGIKPKVVLAENVPGLAMTRARGVLVQILDAIRAEGYRVQARILAADEFGVPQNRRRLIIQGVREDLGVLPAWPEPLPYRYLVREAWESVPEGEKTWCGRYRVGQIWANLLPGEEDEIRFNLKRLTMNQVSFTITQIMGNAKGNCKHPAQVMHPSECRYLTIPEAKRICSFPDDFRLIGTFSQQYERLGRAVPPLLYKSVGEAIRDRVLNANL